jgi:hypothetical protein
MKSVLSLVMESIFSQAPANQSNNVSHVRQGGRTAPLLFYIKLTIFTLITKIRYNNTKDCITGVDCYG